MGPDSIRVVRFYAVLMMYVTFQKVKYEVVFVKKSRKYTSPRGLVGGRNPGPATIPREILLLLTTRRLHINITNS